MSMDQLTARAVEVFTVVGGPDWLASLQLGLGTVAAVAAAFAILLALAVLVSGR